MAPPAKAGEWELRFGNNDATEGWEQLCREAPGNTRSAWDALSKDPRGAAPHERQHRLKGKLSTCLVQGRTLEQWQFEVTAGGRIWYAIDDENRRVVLVYASTKHPKITE